MTITIEYSDEAQLIAKCKAIIDSLHKPPASVTVGELARIVGRTCRSVSRSLRSPSCPAYDFRAGGSGRILRLTATHNLINYLKQ